MASLTSSQAWITSSSDKTPILKWKIKILHKRIDKNEQNGSSLDITRECTSKVSIWLVKVLLVCGHEHKYTHWALWGSSDVISLWVLSAFSSSDKFSNKQALSLGSLMNSQFFSSNYLKKTSDLCKVKFFSMTAKTINFSRKCV